LGETGLKQDDIWLGFKLGLYARLLGEKMACPKRGVLGSGKQKKEGREKI